MVGINLGPKHDLAMRLAKLDKNTRQLNTRDVLQNASIGAGGLLVTDGGNITINGGSLIITGTGTITVPGGLSSAGTIAAATSITAGTSLNGASLALAGGGTAAAFTGNDLFTLNGPTFNITGGRVTCWLENATGRVAMATSSRRFKQDEIDANIDPRAILSIRVKYWHYIAEIRKRDDPTFEEYVGPEYHVALNFGPIAEDLDAAGLWMCVIYEHEDDGTLKLDASGKPIPFSIHDSLWGYLEHIVMQWLAGRLDDVEARLTKAGL